MTTLAQIIVAGGKGMRTGGRVPKQYLNIHEKPVIYRTLQALSALEYDKNANNSERSTCTVIVHAEGDEHLLESSIGDFSVSKVLGGSTRSASVRAGLESLRETPPDYVMIHDAARPFVSLSCLRALMDKIQTFQAAVPVLPIVDAVKLYTDEEIGDDVDRSSLRKVQTPQVFHFHDILTAYESLPVNIALSDDIAVARRAGLSVGTVPGEENNFKITYPEDFEKAETLIKANSMTEFNSTYTATGSGYDVHRYTDGDGIWLCGIKIPAPYTLLGHSDADAGLHALTDAIFGAMADGDIGVHFPPTDPQWANASSDKFLKFAVDRLLERGGKLQHVDVTLICEKPKIKPHRDNMRRRISEIINLPLSRISVKATTTEKLGFTGREEGLAAQAIASVVLPE